MDVETNKVVVRRWIEAYNRRDMTAEAAARTEDYVAHVPGVPVPFGSGDWQSFILGFADAFPDLHLAVEGTVASGGARHVHRYPSRRLSWVTTHRKVRPLYQH